MKNLNKCSNIIAKVAHDTAKIIVDELKIEY